MRTIVIPTDFSKNALHAIRYAQELYKCERAIFFVLHAYADEVYGQYKTTPPDKVEELKRSKNKEVEQKLDVLISKIVGKPPNPFHSFRAVAVFDTLVDGVNDFVQENNVDVVIMGTKGETSDHKTTFGSYTIEVFKYVQCPVIAVPEDFQYKQPRNILFPTDYMLPYKRRELKLLGDLAGSFKSKIHCLYFTDFDELSPRQEDNKQFLKNALERAYLFFETAAVKNKADAIMEYIQEKEVTLLVMLNSRHSFFEDMLYRSTVDLLGLKLKIPFLVMQNLHR